ncbi:MAG: hypothetical protein RLZZ618_1945 [Pseudomonadota bacterium]|jgi:predicted glycoside hydrolase/deacetylase ChbG (UPF0249 family)
MTPPPARLLSVCADDFGMSMGVSAVIADLASRSRLTHISCLTNGTHWRQAAPLLGPLVRPVTAGVEAGLHFNLTDGAPLSRELAAVWPRLPSLTALIRDAHLRRLPLSALCAEWAAQWQAFTDQMGAAPAFVDGHQHVHHLPGVRDVMLAALSVMPESPAVRSTALLPGPGFGFKRWAIRHTGGRALQAELVQRRMRHNAVLLGAYDFKTADYRGLMQQWLSQVPPEGALLFCHPGVADAGDVIGEARLRERAYLGSSDFALDLARAGVTLGRAWRQA